MQGPGLTNSWIGALCTFRQEITAITCAIEGMFHQFKVDDAHRDNLRFLWWMDSDYSKSPSEFGMTVYLFGAKSSPSCANFGFKQIALDGEQTFGEIWILCR